WRSVTGQGGFHAIVSISDPVEIVSNNGAYHLGRGSGWEPGGHFSQVKVTLVHPVRQNGSVKDSFQASVRQLGSPFLAGESVPANFLSEFLPGPDGDDCDCDELIMFVGALEIIDGSADIASNS
ncbi:MAG: hypothetical protein MI741_11205, partial [Rhodospirillales bacterium]|nr:hypothetical protein [Rhodospirillales bacterium]